MIDQDEKYNYAALINREMEILDYKSMMKQKFKEGFEIGLKEAREEWREEGREEGSEEATIKHLICLIKKKNFSVEEALTTLDIPEDQWESIKAKLK